jgi:hypothetical protein
MIMDTRTTELLFIPLRVLPMENKEIHFNWVDQFTLSPAELDAIAEPEWIIPNLIIAGHLILIPAEPNGGKTTIMLYLSSLMAKKGLNVLYVNADTASSDAKAAANYAREYGFTMLLPDFKVGLSIKNVGRHLQELADMDVDLTNYVVVIDTLKKLIDVLDKRFNKSFFSLMRKLTAKGMTIILLAHTNKHKNEQGLPVYEGTGDMRSDVDELIYFLPVKNNDGSVTVTTKPDKVRGVFEPMTFTIDADRKVTQEKQAIDVAKLKHQQCQQAKDQINIDIIVSILTGPALNQKEILSRASNFGLGERICKSLLRGYSDQQNILPVLWTTKRGSGKEVMYELKNI